MKRTRKILYSVLIFMTIITLFLPVAVSVDNRVEELEAQIRKEEGGMTRSVDKLTRENDKVTKAAKDAKPEEEGDKEMLAEIEAAGDLVTELEAKIKAVNVFVKAAEAVTVDEPFATELKKAVDAAKARKAELEPELTKAKNTKSDLDKKWAAIQAERDFIKPVELEDEEGNLIALKDVLQAELDANPDVFASRSETEIEEFNKWKNTLDAKRVELDEEKAGSKLYDPTGRLREEYAAEGAVLTEEEQYLVTALQDSDERYTVMIMIVREQVAVNAMAADAAADQAVLKKLKSALDGVYKQIGKVNKEQENVDAVRTAGEEMMAADPIDPVYIALLPNRLPVADNHSGDISESITKWEDTIGPLKVEIAELEELLSHATADGVKAIEDEKKLAEEKLVTLKQEEAELLELLAAAQLDLEGYETGKPVATEEENTAIVTIEGQQKNIEQLAAADKKVDEVISAAMDLKAKDDVMTAQMDSVIEGGNGQKAVFSDKTTEAESVIADQEVILEGYTANVTAYDAGLGAYADPVASAAELLNAKQNEIKETEAAIAAAEKLLGEITGKKLVANQEKKAELEDQLAEAEAELAYYEAELATHKMELNLPRNAVKPDMQTVNTWGALYPTTFRDITIAAYIVFVMLVAALILVWIPGDKLVSKCYTFASFANLIAVVVTVYALLRLMAIPMAQPYSNPSILAYVAIPMLVLPIAALLLHSSGVINTKRTMIYVLCISLCVLSLLPFWLMIVNATRSTQEIQQGVSMIPSSFLKNNWNILQAKHFDVMLGFKNSAIIAFGSTLLGVYFSALTAYGLTVYRFKGAKFLYAVILAIIMIPGQVTGTGFFMFMYQLEWTNSYLPLIIPAIASASTVFFFKQYLEANFQVSLVEAARIDGASEFYTYNRIVLPIMIPAMATMGIMAVIGSWNNYLTPLMLLSKSEMKTLPMMVKELRGDIYRTEYGSIYLGLTLTAMPLLIVYFLFSKYIIAGVAVGGVKE